MFHTQASAAFPFPPDAVFAAVGGVESALRWQAGVLGVRRARHTARGVGGTATGALLVRYYALGARHALTVRVTAYDPPRRFAYRAEGDAFALDVSLEAAPVAGGTWVTYHVRLTSRAPAPGASDAARAVAEHQAAALRRLLARRAPRDLARLEAHVARRLGAAPRVPAPGARLFAPPGDADVPLEPPPALASAALPSAALPPWPQ